MSARPEADPQLGRTLGGQYRIEALLGAGGMGRVYRGRQLSVNRAVAIKLIAGQAPYPPEWVRRFRREAEATASLSHPNSVRLFDFGVTESDELFMVMELLEGSDLARQLQAHGPLPLVTALSIARQVLLALCEAHALGITHRDIKPDNIFLATVRGADVVAKVMDFGIAGLAQQRKSRLTGAGVIIGTPMYMSPEQAQGLPVDGKSDVYSLGVVLFEMLTGRPVFDSHTAVTLLLAHVVRPPMRLDEAGMQLHEQGSLQALLDALLAKDPARRPSAADALNTVTALSARLGIAGATGTMRAISPSPAPPPSAAGARTPVAPQRERAANGSTGARLGPPPLAAAAHSSSTRDRLGPPPLAAAAHSSSTRDRLGPPPLAAAAHSSSTRDRLGLPPSAATSDNTGGTLAGAPSAAVGEVALARDVDAFQIARPPSAATGALLRPGLVLLGAALVLGAASALALRWGPVLIAELQPEAADAAHVATPAPEQRTVLINSLPSGAQVLLDGEKIGTTPFQLVIQGDAEISVARPGYVRQLVSVPYDARSPVLVKLSAQPEDKPKSRARSGSDDKSPFHFSFKQESLPRIGPRTDADHEQREHGAGSAQPSPDDATMPPSEAQAIEHAEAEPEVVRPSVDEAPELRTLEARPSRTYSTGPARRMGDERAESSAHAQERARVAELASEHDPARGYAPVGLGESATEPRTREEPPLPASETSRSAATNIEAIRADEVAEIALDDDERAHVSEHYGLRALGRAVARAFGRLLIPYPNRERRAALAKMPLMYLSFREARAAYKHGEVDATGFQEAVWQLRERRRQRIWTERDRYSRGELSQAQYQARVDRIWEEFWGRR